MKLLRDTHVWLWSLGAPERLGGQAIAAIQDQDNELWLSPISIWELSLLVSKDRIQLNRLAGVAGVGGNGVAVSEKRR